MLNSSVQSRILNTLPDDRPITAIQIVEDISKCPRGFYPISKTYDQDSDADLRDSSIFKSGAARYLCLSKTEGIPNFAVQEIIVLNDKYSPPKGFSLLNRTVDTSQKAWKKKQLCYRLANRKDIRTAITDVIVCSRLKKAPSGFFTAGELNGINLCYKMGNVQTAEEQPRNEQNSLYPNVNTEDDLHDYEILRPPVGPVPARPAPKPPAPPAPQHNAMQTLGPSSSHYGLEGVPFVVNPKFLVGRDDNNKSQLPRIKAKTLQQIIKEYDYSFTIERQT